VTLFLWNILLAVTWAAVAERFSPANLGFGFGLGYAILWLAQPALGPSNYFRKVRQVIGFAVFFVRELVKANLRVAHDVLTPTLYTRPGTIAVPLDVTTDAEITVLATLITLTPGTLSLDVSADRRVLYIHAMFIDDPEALRREIKEGFERRTLELLR
jgi:multicomponent Na+:H+ antiporter subunit E